MASFIFCLSMLLMAMAATASAKPLDPSSIPSEGRVDTDNLTQIVQQLASRPIYEGPYEVVFDGPGSANDTDTSGPVGKRSRRYVNSLDSAFLFICPYGQSISRISSYHNNNYEDRRFSIDCATPRSSISSCSLSGYVNGFDQQFTYYCPSNSVMSGMGGYHRDSYEDRRWNYWCCGGSLRFGSCYWTSYVNYFDEYFNFYVPYGSYLTGVSSYHDNGYEDRRFQFRICY